MSHERGNKDVVLNKMVTIKTIIHENEKLPAQFSWTRSAEGGLREVSIHNISMAREITEGNGSPT